MLTLIAKLNELDGDGQFLARLLQNEDRAPLQGADVSVDKFSKVFLRSVITRTERTRKFDANGNRRTEPLSEKEEKSLAATVRVYDDADNSLYSFTPVLELYNRGNRCAHCLGMPDVSHVWQLNAAETHAEQINRLGRYFRWWIAEGDFEPIAPREPDMETHQQLNALFGKKREIPIDEGILTGRGQIGEISEN